MNLPFRKDKSKKLDLHPSLEEVVTQNGLDPTKLVVGLAVKKTSPPPWPREHIPIADGTKVVAWNVPSLRALFRGDKVAPSMPDGPPPFYYMPLFEFIEGHVIIFCDDYGDKTDGEFEEVYSNLRRRPDGKSFNPLHFFLWQVGALLVGKQPVSASEFEAIIGRLTRSASTFRIGQVSRNYITTLRNFG